MTAKNTPRTPSITTALAHCRVERGLSIRELAEQTGFGKSTLSRVEKGQATPSKACARALYQFFDGSVAIEDIYDALFKVEVDNGKTDELPAPMTFEELNYEYAKHKEKTGHDFINKMHMINGQGKSKKPYGCDDCYRMARVYESMR